MYEFNNSNTYNVVTGSFADGMRWASGITMNNMTFFVLSKYANNATLRQRIINFYQYNAFIGHGFGKSGICLAEFWITTSDVDYHGDNWVLSTASLDYYRSNGINRTVGKGLRWGNTDFFFFFFIVSLIIHC